ncbi:MAG: hypothetical protein Hyperionvirus32_25, partial [Hyperionvirus sp.]
MKESIFLSNLIALLDNGTVHQIQEHIEKNPIKIEASLLLRQIKKIAKKTIIRDDSRILNIVLKCICHCRPIAEEIAIIYDTYFNHFVDAFISSKSSRITWVVLYDTICYFASGTDRGYISLGRIISSC